MSSKFAKKNQLKAQWGKLPHESPDLIFSNGEGTSSADRSLLYYMFCSDRQRWDYEKNGMAFDPSFVKELENRGYDIKTLKFSIQKKDEQ
jgi:hypothetical protein